ncbi:MAG TPA: hypothetical protein VNA04_12075 [Thermoanaerobaculia bacterium]|nr:hypothetical protein [Thermoanaerobaculia bacterium]
MNAHEPMTVATDSLLALAAALFGVRLWRAGPLAWALAFFATAAAAVLGGTYHGTAWQPLWKPTVYAVGVASLFLLAGLGRPFAIFGIAKFFLYGLWMAVHDDFVYVIADYGLTLLVVGGHALVTWGRRRASFAPWLLGSIAVSLVAAAVQQSGFALHRHFNHNDLYHLIQIVALWLLHRGGLLLTTTPTAPPTPPPR